VKNSWFGTYAIMQKEPHILFTYGLFNDALDSSDYTASSNHVTTQDNVQYYDNVNIYST
jgi:hypothetical protein